MHIAVLERQSIVFPPGTGRVKETGNVEVLHDNFVLDLFLIDRDINTEEEEARFHRVMVGDCTDEIESSVGQGRSTVIVGFFRRIPRAARGERKGQTKKKW